MSSRRTVLDRLVGDWTSEATHPAMPGTVLKGTASFAWLEGEKFLVWRSHVDHPEVPDGMSIVGDCGHATAENISTEPAKLVMHYFDARGVYRLFDVRLEQDAFEVVRGEPWAQRFHCVLADGDNHIDVVTQLRRNDRWEDDLKMTLRRR